MTNTWLDYQNQYMEKTVGPYWDTGGYCNTDGFTEQSAFLSFIYATAKWACDKVSGLFD